MKRVVTGTLVLILTLAFGATRALAAGGPESKPRFDFSARAAGIEALVKADQARPLLAAVPARAPQGTTTKKSFWKTPWPYVIIGGAAAIAGIVIATSGNGDGY
jgi:hypothetical protein